MGKGRQREREREREGEGRKEGEEKGRGREIYIGKCGGGIRAKEIAYANLQKLYSLALIDLRHREARAALDSPLTPCTTTGTKQPVLHSSPPPPHSLGGFCTLSLTPCMTTGTKQPVLHSSPPVRLQAQSRPCCTRIPPITPCTTTGTKQPVLHSNPPHHSLYDYRYQAARAALESPPSLPVRLQAQSRPCCTRVPPPPLLPIPLQAQSSPCCTRLPPITPCTTTGTKQPVLHSNPPHHSLYDYRYQAARAALESPHHSLYDYRYQAARAALESPPSLPVRLQVPSSPCCTRVPPHSLYDYRHQAARAALESPPSLPVRLQAQSRPCCTRVPPITPCTTTGTE